MFSKAFWCGVLERAVKTAAQFALVGGLADATNVLVLDWRQVVAAAGAGFVVSVATSLGSLPFGPSGSPSVVSEGVEPPV